MSKNFILILKYQRFGQSNCFSPPLPPLVSYGSPCLSATFQSTIVLPIQQDKLLSVNIPLWICFVKGNISNVMAARAITTTGADPGGSLGSQDPLQKYIREAKRMMYWYKITLKCVIS